MSNINDYKSKTNNTKDKNKDNLDANREKISRLKKTVVSLKTSSSSTNDADKSGLITESFKIGWELYKNHAVFLTVSFLIIIIISFVFSKIAEDRVFITLLVSIFQVIIGIGSINIIKKIYDGENVGIGDFFNKTNKFFIYLIAGILAQFIVMGGFVLFFIPGFIAAVALSFITFLIIDKNMGILQPIRSSWIITKSYRGKLFLFGLISLGAYLIGLLAFGLGIFVAIPVVALAGFHFYRVLLSKAEKEGRLPVEKLPIVPKIFLWIGILLIPISIMVSVIFVSIGGARLKAEQHYNQQMQKAQQQIDEINNN